jgi:acetyl esterase
VTLRPRWKVAIAAAAALAITALGVVWSWTRTPYGPLDLGAALVIHTMPSDLAELSPEARRTANGWTRRFMGEGVPIRRIVDTTFPGPVEPRRVRVYVPEGEGPFPIVYWIHGGGWWMGDELEMWDGMITPIVRDVPAVVVSPDYRLAPEHPFPAAVEDSWAGLLWAVEHAGEWRADPTRVGVYGGSAGGNLAAAMALRARDHGGPPIRVQILVVPSLNLGGEPTESMRLFSNGFGLNGIDVMRAAYLSRDADPVDPMASPLLAKAFTNLPPALIITAQFDPLRDEGELYGKKLQQAGVEATVHRFDGAIHGMLGSGGKREHSNRMTIEALRTRL